MKKYTVIYFNEDGGCNISCKTKEDINKLLEEIPFESFINYAHNYSDSMNGDYVYKYMIIEGIPILPTIVEKITKLKI